jgi:hypothetical protein
MVNESIRLFDPSGVVGILGCPPGAAAPGY